MKHLLISINLLALIIIARIGIEYFNTLWQEEHQQEIQEYKRQHGKNKTLFFKGYHITSKFFAILIWMCIIYIVLSLAFVVF